jgi:ubiquinol-cytochrome c reductase cytochrome b subunit
MSQHAPSMDGNGIAPGSVPSGNGTGPDGSTAGSGTLTGHPAMKALSAPAQWLDDRAGIAKSAKAQLRKVFPDHWSFLLGEIVLYSFILLLLSGVFLTLWFKPSMEEVVYNGSYAPLTGVHMSQAFASTLHMSFDVRGGLLVRQIHHWAALVFMAAMTLHMLRIFFTGAFRKPREINWLLGLVLINLGFLEGFAGYSLPDDLLSGTGLRVAEGMILSIPVVGSYISFFVFGGEFPGADFIPRLYSVHILLVPGILLALVALHILLVFYLKHTQMPGPGRTDKNVVGYPFFPVYVAKAGGYFFAVSGVIVLMSGTMTINPVWLVGPYNPAQVSADAQPDWYVGWLDGGLRMMPHWETHLWGFTLSWNVLIPFLGFMGILYTALGVYPFFERWITGDTREHHVLDRPRNQPTRTAFGAAGITAYGLCWAVGGNDVLATQLHLSIYQITYFARIAVFVLPVLIFILTRRICIGMQRRDASMLLHGYESGTIMRSPDGSFSELHKPLDVGTAYMISAHERQAVAAIPSATDSNGVRRKGLWLDRQRAKWSNFYFGNGNIIEKPTVTEIEAAHAHGSNGTSGYGGTNGHGADHAEVTDGDRDIDTGELTGTGSTARP